MSQLGVKVVGVVSITQCLGLATSEEIAAKRTSFSGRKDSTWSRPTDGKWSTSVDSVRVIPWLIYLSECHSVMK